MDAAGNFHVAVAAADAGIADDEDDGDEFEWR